MFCSLFSARSTSACFFLIWLRRRASSFSSAAHIDFICSRLSVSLRIIRLMDFSMKSRSVVLSRFRLMLSRKARAFSLASLLSPSLPSKSCSRAPDSTICELSAFAAFRSANLPASRWSGGASVDPLRLPAGCDGLLVSVTARMPSYSIRATLTISLTAYMSAPYRRLGFILMRVLTATTSHIFLTNSIRCGSSVMSSGMLTVGSSRWHSQSMMSATSSKFGVLKLSRDISRGYPR
mmetsp:Transcript_27410/g.68402  ORF Transcript_27410/g.68402 Transcript_27410/m.68402 type:complete len:236 (+) Transcript_27410:287-994(+)